MTTARLRLTSVLVVVALCFMDPHAIIIICDVRCNVMIELNRLTVFFSEKIMRRGKRAPKSKKNDNFYPAYGESLISFSRSCNIKVSF